MKYLALLIFAAFASSCGTTTYYHKLPPKKVAKPGPTTPTAGTKNTNPTVDAGFKGTPVVATPTPSPAPMDVASNPAPVAPLVLNQNTSTTSAPVMTPLDELKSFVDKSVNIPSPQDQEIYKAKAIAMLDSLSVADLQNVVRDSDYGYVRAYALMKLGETAQRDRDYANARKYYTTVIEFAPESDLAIKARTIITNIDGLKKVNARSIGAILPLTGKNKAVGERVLRAIRMGLGSDDPNSNLQLTVVDDEGNSELAKAAVDKLVKENEVVSILGGLLSKEATSIAQKAEEYGVPTITLSQKAGLTEVGSSIFRHAVTSEMQVRALVKHAMQNLEVKKFAIVYPNDAYGVEFANLFWDEVLARGGEVTAVQTYSPDEKDFNGLVQRMVGTFYVEGRMDEFQAKSKALKLAHAKMTEKTKRSSRDKIEEDDILTPIVDFDAVFIPDTGKAFGQIASFFNFNNIKDIKFLGPNIWNTQDIAKRAHSVTADVVFVDAADLNAAEVQATPFFTEYKNKYGEVPTLLEVQAFEAASMARSVLSQRSYDRNSLQSYLSSLKEFPGVTGPLNMNQNREVQRPLVTFSITNGVMTTHKN